VAVMLSTVMLSCCQAVMLSSCPAVLLLGDVPNCPRPENRIFGGHGAAWREARIGIAVLSDVGEVLRATEQSALAHALANGRRTQRGHSLREIVQHRRGQESDFTRVHERKEKQVRVEQGPVHSEATAQPRPLDD